MAKLHAWYSATAHRFKSFPLLLFDGGRTIESYGYLWYVTINGKKVLATQIANSLDDKAWDDSVYLGELDNNDEEPVRATQVPIQY